MRQYISKKKQTAKGKKYEYPIPDCSPNFQDKPVFSFHYLQSSHCISRCDHKQKAAFADKMHELSSLTWQQIRTAPHQGLGSEKIARDCFLVSIPEQIAEDEDLLSIRFYGKAPMIGVRRGQIFHILWFDINFNVYKHSP